MLGALLNTAFSLLNTAFSGYMAARRGSQSKAMGKEWRDRDNAIPLDDPEQRGILNRLAAQERHYRTGTDMNTAYANRLANSAGAQAQANIVRAGGPGIVQNLLSSQMVTGRQLGANAAQAAGMANEMLGAQASLVNLMAQRRYDRQRYRRDQALLESQQYRQDANNYTQAAISGLGQNGRPAMDGAFGGFNRSGGSGGSF